MKLCTGVGEADLAVSAGIQAANAEAVMGHIETAWCLLAESGICVRRQPREIGNGQESGEGL